MSEVVRRNRTWMVREKHRMVAGEVVQGAYTHLEGWPRTSSSLRRCGLSHRCEYVAIYAQRIADERLAASRRRINTREEDFERIAFEARPDLARGLSPEQICLARPHLGLCPSTLEYTGAGLTHRAQRRPPRARAGAGRRDGASRTRR